MTPITIQSLPKNLQGLIQYLCDAADAWILVRIEELMVGKTSAREKLKPLFAALHSTIKQYFSRSIPYKAFVDAFGEIDRYEYYRWMSGRGKYLVSELTCFTF